MKSEDQAIEIDGLAFSIPSESIESILDGGGLTVRLTGLNVRMTEDAINALLARLKPEDQPEPTRAHLTSEGVTIDHHDGARAHHLNLAVADLRIEVRDGMFTLKSG